MGSSIDRFLRETEPSAEKPPKSEFARWLDEDDVQQRLSAADTATRAIQPPQAARVLTLAKQTGIDPDTVERNADLVESEAKKEAFDATAFRQEFPNVAKWLAQQPQHIALARNDLDRLGYIERQVRNIRDQFTRGKRTVELSDIGERVMWRQPGGDDRARQQEIEREFGTGTPDYGFRRRIETIPGHVANQLPILARGIKGALKGGAVGAAAGGAAALATGALIPGPEEVATVPIGAGRGALIGGKIGLAVNAGRIEANLAYLDFEKIRDDDGLPLERDTMRGAALIVGAVNGALEATSLQTMLKNVPGLRALGRDAVKKALASQTMRGAFVRYAKSVAEAMGVEGTTEAMQSLVTNMAGEFSAMVQDGSISTLSTGALVERLFGRHLGEALGEAEAGALAGGGISAVAGATALPGDFDRARGARRNFEFFRGLGEAMSESEMVKLAPDKAEEVIEALTRDGPVEKLYTPVEVWQEYWQSKELDPADVAEQLIGNREEYDQAVRTGGDLAIPTSRYATYLAPTEHNAFFERELKASPDVMSAREADEFAERLDEEASRAEEAAPQEEGARSVQDVVSDQLRAAGFDEQTARTYAELYGAGFRTLGERTGQDPLALFERFGLTISRPDLEGAPLDIRTMPLEEVAQRAMAMRAAVQETETERAAVTEEAGTRTAESLYTTPLTARESTRLTEQGQFVYARDAKGALRRDFGKVATDGLIDEIVRMFEAQSADAQQAVVWGIPDESGGTFTSIGRSWVGMKPRGIAASGRIKQRAKAIARAEAELAKRGVTDVNERVFAQFMGRPVEGATDVSFDFALEQAAFHGSPHIFDRFDLTKIGTGEGAQAYGWGLYFAGKREIAEYYRRVLSTEYEVIEKDGTRRAPGPGEDVAAAWLETAVEGQSSAPFQLAAQQLRHELTGVIRETQSPEQIAKYENALSVLARWQEEGITVARKRGRLYKVEIPDDDTFLLWDKPLSEQPEKVREALHRAWLAHREAHHNMTGRQIYQRLGSDLQDAGETLEPRMGAQEAASRKLASLGINGIKYLDSSSRGQRIAYDPAYEVAAKSFYDSGASFDEATQGMRQAYRDAPAIELDAALRDAYGMEPSPPTYNYVVFDDQLIEIVEFEQRKQNIPRGRIKIGQGRAAINIELLKDADLSTFLHETGHFYLEVLDELSRAPNADGDIVADMQTIRAWVGAAEGEAFTVEQHEQWARGFEQYLLEGKAPSSALRAAFAKFRAWLVFTYRSLRGLDVELTPEVRAVMDRLLATETEIAAAEAEQVMVPLFPDPSALNLPPDVLKAYGQEIADARATAQDELAGRLIRDYQRELSDQWRAERVKVREEVAQEVNQEPASLAYAVLGRAKLPDGSPIPDEIAARLRDEEGKPLKLSKRALEAEYAVRPEYENLLRRLPRPFVYSKEGGMHPDQAADIFGFRSGDELIQALLTAEEPRRRIERITDVRMRERHSDELLSPDEVSTEAMKAVMSEKRDAVLRREMQILASESFATVKGLVRRIAGPIPATAVMRAEADAWIARRRIREIQPITYQRAAQKAARNAVTALTKGDVELAFHEKDRERVNLALFRAATNAREQVEGIAQNMRRFDKRSVRERLGKAGSDYLDQIDALRERYDFARGLSRAQLAKRKSLIAFVEEQKALGIEIEVPESLLEEADRTHYTDLTVEELRGLDATVKQIEHLAGLKNRLLHAVKVREIEEARTEIVGSIGTYFDLAQRPPDRFPGLLAKVAKIGLAEHTRMEFLFEALDGGKAQGPVWQHLFKPFADAEITENEMRRQDATALKAIFGAYTKAERNGWFSDRLHIPEAQTSRSSPTFTKQHLLAIALNWGNAYNRQALMEGYGWNEAQVQQLLERLDARDWATVQAIWDYIGTYWPQASALEREITGLAPEKVEATEVVTRFGTFRGGYYPIVFDRELSTRQAALDESADVAEMFGGLAARAMTKHGHLKERTNTGGKPLLLDLTVIPRHLSQVTHDLAYRRAVIDVARLIRDPEISTAVERSVGTEMYRQLGPWVKAIAGDRPREYSSWIAGLFGKARAGATVVALGLRVTSSLMQTLGYTLTVNQIGAKYATLGVRDAFKSGPRIWKLVEEGGFIGARSPMMRERMQNYDRDVRDFGRKLSNISGEQANWFILIGYMDLAVSVPTWLGAYRKAMDGGLENVEKGDEQAAVDYADSVVRQSQSAGAAKDLASIQRGGEVQRAFTMFYSSLGVIFNQFERTRRQFIQDHNVPRLLASLALIWFVPALLEDAIRGRMPDDDDDDSWLAWLIGTVSTYPLATVIGVRDLAFAVERKLTTGGRAEFTASPAFEAWDALAGAATTAVKAAHPDQDVTRGDLKEAVMAVGYLTKLPSKQMWQTGEAFYDWYVGDWEPENPALGLWQAVATGKPRQ